MARPKLKSKQKPQPPVAGPGKGAGGAPGKTKTPVTAPIRHVDEDTKLLHNMGYAQELARRMSGFSNFAISFSIICILAGGITAFPNIGIYHASKWALEGFTQSLAQEVAPFGIHVTLIEPASFDTDWGGSSAKLATRLPAYQEAHAAADAGRSARAAGQGNPNASAAAVLKVVDAEEPPLRVFFGTAPLGLAKADYENRLRTWEQWQPVAELAQG